MPEQPMPKPGGRPVKGYALATFARMIDERTEKGIQTYGRALETHNGRDALQDLMEELVDAVQYTTQAALERADLNMELDRLAREVASLTTLNQSLDRRVAELEAENTALAERVQRGKANAGS